MIIRLRGTRVMSYSLEAECGNERKYLWDVCAVKRFASKRCES